MKKYIWLYAILTILLFAGFLFYYSIARTVRQQQVDFVAVNEIVSCAERNWENPEKLDGMEFAYRFFVIDNRGNKRYESESHLREDMPSAVRNGYIPMDIVVRNRAAGKVLIDTSSGNDELQIRKYLDAVVLSAFIFLCLINLIFLYVLHRILIKPFKKLEDFSHKITTGRFDEPLPMDKNNTFGLFTQSFDVMRDSLLEARKQRIQAERANKELIASLNHDVKTPVTAIRLISELLQEENTNREIAGKLKTIESKADQIDYMMNDMLHSTLEDLGEFNVVVSGEQSSILRSIFEAADYLSKVHIGEIPSCLIEIDRSRMEQVIGNILSNSYKYAGTRIDVSFRIHGELLQVDIDDYGKGVEPEELELITTKFYRSENARQMKKEGEGLGLYIVKLLMDKMDGGAEALNRKDGFTIRLWIRLSG